MSIFYDSTQYGNSVYSVNVIQAGLYVDEETAKITIQLTIHITGKSSEEGEVKRLSTWPDRVIYLPITEKTMGTAQDPGWVRATLLSFGFDLNTWKNLEVFKKDGLIARCIHDDFTGKMIEKWSLITRKAAPTPSKQMLDELVKLYGSRSANPRKNSAAPSKILPAPSEQEDINVIPF